MTVQIKASTQLRGLLAAGTFLHLPSVYDPLTARLAQAAGFEAAYVGGYVTGAMLATTEPLVTLTEQVEVAGRVAHAVSIPILADAGAGFGEPLHAMRTVREFATAGIAGIHIEDQLYPKRAHYHKHRADAIDEDDYADKIRYACRERDRVDPDFVVIARTDTCRFHGLDEAARRINRAAAEGADLGLLFPRNLDEAKRAPGACRVPLVYVQSRGNSDGRPLFDRQQLIDMGYVACIDAQVVVGAAFDAVRNALAELRATGRFTGIGPERFVSIRKSIEDLIDLEAYYDIEAETVLRGETPHEAVAR